MKHFKVTLRKAGEPPRHFFRPAYDAAAAYDLVAAEQGDAVYGITVVPA
jgi:hypothetical protein